MWTDASGNHSEQVIIACGCGVQVADKMQSRYAAKAGDTGWAMLYGEWAVATQTAADKWDALMGPNDEMRDAMGGKNHE